MDPRPAPLPGNARRSRSVRSDFFPVDDVDGAYAVQRVVHDWSVGAGRKRVGWKVGLTDHTSRSQFGAGEPVHGVLYSDMQVIGGRVPHEALDRPYAEVEMAFRLGADLAVHGVTRADVLAATEAVTAGIELVDARVDLGSARLLDLVADNAFAGMFALGDWIPYDGSLTWGTTSELQCGERCSATTGDLFGQAVDNVAWLAGALLSRGWQLREADVVMSGALCGMVPVVPGELVVGRIAGLDDVAVVCVEPDGAESTM